MEIKTRYESQEDIPAELRSNYEEDGEGYRLKLLSNYVPADKVEDVSGLKSALRKERENVSKLTGKLKSLEGKYGTIDPEEVEGLRQELDKFKGREAELSQAARDAKQAKDKALKVATALQAAGGNVALLADKVAQQVKVAEDGTAYAVDGSGTPLLGDDGQRLSVDALIAQYRANPLYKAAFTGSGNSGGGSAGAEGGLPLNGKGQSKDALPPRKKDWTARQKVDYIREHGEDALLAHP